MTAAVRHWWAEHREAIAVAEAARPGILDQPRLEPFGDDGPPPEQAGHCQDGPHQQVTRKEWIKKRKSPFEGWLTVRFVCKTPVDLRIE